MTIPIQLAIQGGGAKLTYLLAALEAVQQLERDGVVRVTRIAGTSAGAIAGALYAARIDMERARDTFEAHREELLAAFPEPRASFRAAWRLLWRKPFWDAAPLRRVLARLFGPCERLGDLDVPLLIVASDLTNMQPCVYDRPDAPLLSSLMDSAGIPFFFRTVPRGRDGYRVVVDGGICDNLPSDQLTWSEEAGEVLGITFAATHARVSPRSFLEFVRALFETALQASVLRAQLELGPNSFVICTEAGSFDFARAFSAGLGAEYRETRLLAEAFFRRYAQQAAELRTRERAADELHSVRTELPETRLHDVITALRSVYESQQKRVRFEFLSVRMIVTGASQSGRGPDDVRHEIVFRATRDPVSCYRIRLTSATPYVRQKTQCEVFDRNYEPVAFDLVPITDDDRGPREYLLFFREPIAPGDSRSPVTLRVRDTVGEALRLARDGRDELLARASRADRPIGRVEIVVHLPEELRQTVVAAAPGSGGTRMSPSELARHAAPAGFFSLGWKGEHVPPDALFGCHLVKP